MIDIDTVIKAIQSRLPEARVQRAEARWGARAYWRTAIGAIESLPSGDLELVFTNASQSCCVLETTMREVVDQDVDKAVRRFVELLLREGTDAALESSILRESEVDREFEALETIQLSTFSSAWGVTKTHWSSDALGLACRGWAAGYCGAVRGVFRIVQGRDPVPSAIYYARRFANAGGPVLGPDGAAREFDAVERSLEVAGGDTGALNRAKALAEYGWRAI